VRPSTFFADPVPELFDKRCNGRTHVDNHADTLSQEGSGVPGQVIIRQLLDRLMEHQALLGGSTFDNLEAAITHLGLGNDSGGALFLLNRYTF
jgi:hypothetical protein